ncbi:helix-turn-helix domain-containing protein [Methylobacterium sp. E-016]|uniref:helix-turn-helix domain-containing protein n=1 Tax=Methylobacterium sp. E-016 TaxID=2836556 RepID=UPI001FB9AF60|nr:helix-turn-helix domain-containing protein [Methylobacterium sp. E-016]MCJ2075283.1 helix-turn-helix domain-containing protein [Methylobacterium sp. E-016]
MNYAYEIRRQVEAAPRAALPAVASALWKAFGEGHLSEVEAEALAAVIEARQAGSPNRGDQTNVGNSDLAQDRQRGPRTGTGSRPRTDASMGRRRRWAASGRLPPGLAARFTLAEQAVLAVVAVEVAKRGDCRLALDHIAALAGVSRATVRNAIRQAKTLALVTVEERRLARFRSDTNVVCIVSREWTAWLRLTRKGFPQIEDTSATGAKGGGRKFVPGTNTPVSYPVSSEGWRRKKGYRGIEGDPSTGAFLGVQKTRSSKRAM